MKLHEDKEAFITFVTSASQQLNLPEVYIEKDYWVTRSLKQLYGSDVKDQVVFKGGTSLSKAHKLIHRFSEDIDLAAIADGLGDARRKKLLKQADQITSAGLEEIEDDARNSIGSKFRKKVYRYPRDVESDNFGQASPELLIEVNTFTRPEPFEKKNIQTMIADMLVSEGRQDLVEQYNLGSFEINVLSVKRTLIEKLLGIIKDSYFDEPVDRLNIRIRHLYDVCMILRDENIRDFVQSEKFTELCQQSIKDEIDSWGEERASCLLVPLYDAPIFIKLDDMWPRMEQTYNNTFADLVYGDLPEYSEIKETFDFLHQELKK